MNKAVFKTKTFVKATDTINEAGGKAYSLEPKAALAQLVCTGCFNQTFYADSDVQIQQILDLTKNLDSNFIAKTAIFAREKGFMKDMPAMLVAILTARHDPILKKVFGKVIDNGKMLRNFVQIIRSGVTGRRSFGTVPKQLIQDWFKSRSVNEIFNQSVGNNPTFADILKMVHPKPETKEKESLYGWFLNKSQESLPDIVQKFEDFKAKRTREIPAIPFEMLTALDLSIEDWCEIAKKARWHWIRMNLNTLLRHKVFEKKEMVDLVVEKLVDKESISKAKVFPYQLMAAYINVNAEIPQKIKNALQDALEIATDNVPRIDGKVYVLVDVSGSMNMAVTGYRKGSTSKVNCVNVASLISSVILRKNDEAEVIPFSDRVRDIDLNPKDSIMTNAKKISSILGGGTNCSAPMEMLNERKAKGDFVIVVSDNQSWVDTYGNDGNSTKLMQEWTKFRGRNHKAKLVCLDIQPHLHTQAYEKSDILNIGGFSDNVFDLMALFAKDEMGADHWVGEIEKNKLEWCQDYMEKKS